MCSLNKIAGRNHQYTVSMATALLLFFSFFFFAVVDASAASGGARVALFSHIKSTLGRGESLVNNGSTLTLQGDCDLVLRNAKNVIVWNSGSVDPGVDCVFWVGKYGVAIVSDEEGSPLWSTGVPGPPGNYAVLLRPDGRLRTYGPSTWTLEQQSKSAEIITAPPRQAAAARSPPFDPSGYVLYSSEEYIYEPAAGVLLKNGNYSLVLETSCTIHIRRNNYEDQGGAGRPRRRWAKRRAKAPPCKTEMRPHGQLTAYKMLFAGEDGLDDVWVRTWGSNFTVGAWESIAALVDTGTAGELLVYPARQTIA